MVKMPRIADGWLDGDVGAARATSDATSLLRPREIAPPALKPADIDFGMPALPPDAQTGMSGPSQMTASPRLVDLLKSYEKGPDGALL